MSTINVTRALISVFNKEGIIDFAKELDKLGVEIISTGGTFDALQKAGVRCIKIEDYTGQKEFFGGRVKTLHPLIHGGILSKRDDEALKLGIKPIDLVVVNLYPFESIVEKGEKDIDELIEMIDIGGPTMLRSTAKNCKYACPVCDPSYYGLIIDELKNGGLREETRFKLALEVFKTTAYYDSVISGILSQFTKDSGKITGKVMDEKVTDEKIAEKMTIPLKKEIDLRYGENPHQKASFYSVPDYAENKLSGFYTEGRLHGKELSYNNLSDISSVIRVLSDLAYNSCVVVKHSNPCGAATRNTTHESFVSAYEGDSVSIFGGIVGVKGVLTAETARLLNNIFLEIIIAHSYEKEAFDILSRKKNIRLMEYRKWEKTIFNDKKWETKKILGGYLFQEKDADNPYNESFKVVTKTSPADDQIEDLKFAQAIVKNVKSNAIVVVKERMLYGVGAGQMNRVTSAKIALDWAGENAKGAVIGSDAFFPMDDTVKLCAQRGIKAIIQPGGSLKDEDSIKACDELNIPMIFTGIRHFLH
jgi:phosphoribosylaminoimidazolecarboxamide formyltransferase / IMP cyclohydrolase